MTVPFAFILILYSNTFLILQTPSPNTGFTRRFYSVHTARPQRALCAIEDPIALPQRFHIALSYTLCKRQAAAFVLSMLKNPPPHDVLGGCTASLQRVHSALRRSATFLKAVETLWGRRRSGVTGLYTYQNLKFQYEVILHLYAKC